MYWSFHESVNQRNSEYNEIPNNIIFLNEHCLTTVHILLLPILRTFGTAVDSSISPVIANIFMEYFEKEQVLRKTMVLNGTNSIVQTRSLIPLHNR